MHHYTPSTKGGKLFAGIIDSLRLQGQRHGVSGLNEPYTIEYKDITYTIFPTTRTPRMKWAVSNFGPDMEVRHVDGSHVKPGDINGDILHAFTLLTGRIRWVINGELWELRTRKEAAYEYLGDLGSILIFATAIVMVCTLDSKDS